MEDAAKALLIAAGVLIGLMIISLGFALVMSLSQYTDNAQKQIEENALQSFNTQFTKYINCTDLTIHDVITVANIAYENNTNYGLDDASDFNYYVAIKISGGSYNKLEKTISVDATELLKNNSNKTYKCTYDGVKINKNTGRVCEVIFTEN